MFRGHTYYLFFFILFDFNGKARRFECCCQAEEAFVTMYRPQQFLAVPPAFKPAIPFRVLHSAQVMPVFYSWAAVVEAVASALYACKVFAAKDYFHTYMISLLPGL